MGRLFSGNLWRHPDFLRLWAGQSISQIGTRITMLALPTIAILYLHANVVEVGGLYAVQYLPFVLLSLPAGVWIDRWQRRRVLIATDVGRMLALATIPLAFEVAQVTLIHLYAVAIVVGVLSVFFELAYAAYLPSLVERGDLQEGNAKFQLSQSVAAMAGPALGGALIQTIGAALAIVADALSFLASLATLLWIRKREPARGDSKGAQRHLVAELKEGVKTLFGNPALRTLTASTTTSNFANSLNGSLILIFCYRTLHLSPGLVGVAFAVGSVGVVLGAMLSTRVARRFGLGPTLAACQFLIGVGYLCLPAGVLFLPIVMVTLSRLIPGLVNPIYNANSMSLIQTETPMHLMGRVGGTALTTVWGSIALGSVLGGVLGQAIGITQALVVAAGFSVLSSVWILLSPIIRMRVLPAPSAPPGPPAETPPPAGQSTEAPATSS